MAKFRYKAVDSQGKEVMSTVEADSQGAAIEKIRAMKLTPKAIGMVKEDTPNVAATRPAAKPAKKKGGGEIKLPKFMRGGVKTKDLMIFTFEHHNNPRQKHRYKQNSHKQPSVKE